jgi:hypothetical protein
LIQAFFGTESANSLVAPIQVDQQLAQTIPIMSPLQVSLTNIHTMAPRTGSQEMDRADIRSQRRATLLIILLHLGQTILFVLLSSPRTQLLSIFETDDQSSAGHVRD